MGCAEVVWERGRECAGVLGAVWVCEFDLDSCGVDQLVVDLGTEFRVCGVGFCRECGIHCSEFVAGGEGDGCEGQSYIARRCGGLACGISHCHQVLVFHVSIAPEAGGVRERYANVVVGVERL